MKNYVISLTTALDRRTHIINEFGKQNVPFVFFDAMTPAQVDALAQKFNVNITNANLTQGELACLFSHICLWQKAIDENLDYIAIFEDDIYLGENADHFLNRSDWIPQACGLIKLEHFYSPLVLGKTEKTYSHRKIKQLMQRNLGTAGYILSKNMAVILLNYTRSVFLLNPEPIDHIMFDHFLFKNSLNKVYQLTPALCVQSNRVTGNTKVIHSELEQDRIALRKGIENMKVKLNIWQKIIREFRRFIYQCKHFFISSKIMFK